MRNYRNFSKTAKTPLRPFEKERLDAEMKLVGRYGLRNKREIWRVQLVLAKIRKSARILLTLDEKDERRQFEGAALLRRLTRLGLLNENQQRLDFVLSLGIEQFMDRRLQTQVFKAQLANSVHEARVKIFQRHIAVGRRIVNVPSFMVRTESEKHIGHSLTSPYGQGRPGRVARKKARQNSSKGGDE
eukprot:GABV01002352.1.p2 GENE.GABV01002352.1~~GABV01002352.1.p2  ORF type:complete len:195 (-),score=71.75 GABV01002352.1:91-651(-)